MLMPMSMRRRVRTKDLLLVAGDRDDLHAMQHALALLPDGAYGHVFIEVDPAEEILPVLAPSRMTVTWIARSAVRGAALDAALAGWAAEWMPETGIEEGTSTAWIGAIASAGLPHLSELRGRIDRLHILHVLPQLEPDASRP